MIYLFSIRGGNIRYKGHYFYNDGRILCYMNKYIYNIKVVVGDLLDMEQISIYNKIPDIQKHKNIKPFVDVEVEILEKYDMQLFNIIENEILNTIIQNL
jgi:hypothetical protein